MKSATYKRIAAVCLAALPLLLLCACEKTPLPSPEDSPPEAQTPEEEMWQKFSSQEEFAAALQATGDAANLTMKFGSEIENGESGEGVLACDLANGICRQDVILNGNEDIKTFLVKDGEETKYYIHEDGEWSVSHIKRAFPTRFSEAESDVGQYLFTPIYYVAEGGLLTLSERYEALTYSEETGVYEATLDAMFGEWRGTCQIKLRFLNGKVKKYSETVAREQGKTIHATATFTYGTAHPVLSEEAKNQTPDGQKFSSQAEFAAALQATGNADNLIVQADALEGSVSFSAFQGYCLGEGIYCSNLFSSEQIGKLPEGTPAHPDSNKEYNYFVAENGSACHYKYSNGVWSVSQTQGAFPTKFSETDTNVSQYLFERIYYVTEGGGLFTLSERYEAFTYSERNHAYEGTLYINRGEPVAYQMSLRFLNGKLKEFYVSETNGGKTIQTSVTFAYGTANPVLPEGAKNAQ